ncbi:hypothetical protein CEXT_269851, partial [Caerostris extrusa]
TSKRASKLQKSGKVVKEVSLTTEVVKDIKTNFEKRQSNERSITNHYSSAGKEPCSENVKDVKTTVEAPKSGKVEKEVSPTTIAVQEGKLCSENVKDVKTSDEASKSGKVLNDVSPTTIAVQEGNHVAKMCKKTSKRGMNFEKRQSPERCLTNQ